MVTLSAFLNSSSVDIRLILEVLCRLPRCLGLFLIYDVLKVLAISGEMAGLCKRVVSAIAPPPGDAPSQTCYVQSMVPIH